MDFNRGHIMIEGTFELVDDRAITVNDVLVNVPETGQAHIGIELRLQKGLLVSYVRELKGNGGARFGFLHIGDQELKIIKGKLTRDHPTQVPFMFWTPFTRPKMTRN